MNREDAEEFTQSLGQIQGGAWRAVALAVRLGVPASLGLGVTDWVTERLGGYVKLSAGERREAVAELTGDGMSLREIGEVLGVSPMTALRDRAEPVTNVTNEPAETGADVDAYGQPVTNVTSGGRRMGVRPAGTGEIDWYSPAYIVDPARRVMGGIDLDPASTHEANRVIRAERIWTAADDGLSRPWSGRIWLNPPYNRDMVEAFTARAIQAWQAHDVKQACILVNNATETRWFQDLAEVATAIAFPEGRVRYWHDRPGVEITGATQGQAVIYLGGRERMFLDAFGELGLVVTPQ